MNDLSHKCNTTLTVTNKSTTENYPGLDLLKLILAVLVTMLHLKPLDNINATASFMLTNCYTRIAVPIFFTISGMLLFRNMMHNANCASSPKKQTIRLWCLYISWSVLYMPQVIINYISDEKYQGVSIILIILSFIRRFFTIATWTPLWYFLACCYCLPIVYICLKHFKVKHILPIAVLVYFYFSAVCNCYSWLFGESIASITMLSYINNILFKIGTIWSGIAFGLLFMIIGHLAYCKKNYFDHKWLFMITGSFCSVLLLRAEVAWHHAHGIEDMSMMLALIPCSFFILQIFIHLKLKPRKCWAYFRRLSVLIYGLHSIVAFYIKPPVNSLLSYFIIMGIVILLSNFIIFLTPRCKYLSYLQ